MSMVLSYNRKRKLVTLLEIKGYLVKHRCVRGASRTYCLGVIGKEEYIVLVTRKRRSNLIWRLCFLSVLCHNSEHKQLQECSPIPRMEKA